MRRLTFGSYFSGGGLADVGARAAGFVPTFAVEGDPGNWEQSMRIADAYEANLGAHLIRAAVQDIDPADLPSVDWFHASPVCKNASVANANAGEQDVDIITATATAAYIAEHRPLFVTIENVWSYRKFEAWHLIARELTAQGYQFRVDHINMADYGVPQTRKRMIVTAVREGTRPGLLPYTHEQNPQPSLFGAGLPRWVSWYEAIEDLIPSLPDSEFAPWQLDRLPEGFKSLLLSKDKGEWSNGHVEAEEPAQTVTTADGGRRRAFIAANGSYGEYMPCADGDKPAGTVTANHNQATLRAFVFDTKNQRGADGKSTILDKELPMFTTVSSLGTHMPKAFVVNESSTMEVRQVDAPAPTQVSSQRNGNQKAFIVPGGNTSSFSIRAEDEPSRTVGDTARVGNVSRSFVHGRVVKLTPRAIARLQSVPDEYVLPQNDRDAVALLGNGVPCLFMQKLGQYLQRRTIR